MPATTAHPPTIARPGAGDRRLPPAPRGATVDEAAQAEDDTVRGTDSARMMGLIGVFTAAPLVVVAALLAAVAVGTWWALVLLMVVHLVTTAVVFGGVAEVMSGHRPHLRPHSRLNAS